MVTHKGTQTIETKRLILRRARVEDAQAMYDHWASDPEVTKFLTWPPHASVEVTRAALQSWVEKYGKSDWYHWMIVPKDGGDQPIGSVCAVGKDDRVGCFHVGYCIGRAWWHQGIMTEALQGVMDFLFYEVGANRVEACHDVNNPHSGGVMRKCGMQYEGILRQAYWNNQGVCDAAYYGILRGDREDRVKRDRFLENPVVTNDTELVQKLYQRFDESVRLTKTKAARVEFLTSVKYIEEFLPSGGKILDVGAGAGEYSLYFARKGYQVSALELADANIAAFRGKLTEGDRIDLAQGNALDLSRYPDHSFDAVLLFGPLYHLHEEKDQMKCIEEAKRVCKPGGKLFFAFISNDLVILTMQQAHPDYLLEGDYDKETFRLEDFPFVFHTVDRCRELLQKAGVHVCKEVASDGLSELLKDLINAMDDASFQQYLKYHFYICEKKECLGLSNHLLFVGEG